MAVALGAAIAAVACAPGCTVANLMATQDPGYVPRDGELAEVAPVGGDQVCFTFRFKAGPEPNLAEATAAPVGVQTGMPYQITQVRFNDTRGNVLNVADQEIRNEGHVYVITLTSGPADADSYEVICQSLVTVAGYQLKLAGSAYRELDQWRVVPRSFVFGVYHIGQTVPWYERRLWY